MSAHLRREIESLKKQILSISALVEEQVEHAVCAVMHRDVTLAREIEIRDDEVDRREIEIEEDCMKLLALYQPVAVDLRMIVSFLKINNDLERTGDMAVNIARKASTVAALPESGIPDEITLMAGKSQGMLHSSIDALVNFDAVLAKDVRLRDDEVDRMKRQLRVQIQQRMRQNPAQVETLLGVLAISRNLERIADMAVNIAEDVIYMAEGKIIRHSADPESVWELPPPACGKECTGQ